MLRCPEHLNNSTPAWPNPTRLPVQNGHTEPSHQQSQIARLGDESPHLRVSEDKKQIGRKEPLTEDMKKERLARTVQVCA